MKTYAESLAYLYSLQRLGVKLGLDNTRRLFALLGNPHESLRFIHVAGTNGKGSVCAMLASIFRAAGFRTGLYTSPHLVGFCERIQINGALIPEDKVVHLTHRLRALAQQIERETRAHPTYFEIVTALAAAYFREQNADIVIWETGLGGRLDATNIVTPQVSVITNIALDHTQQLGNTLEKITAEKCGIIKPRTPVVTAAEGAAQEIIRAHARAADAPLSVVTTPWEGPLSLRGEQQRLNAALAAAVARQQGIGSENIRDGLAKTEWPARFQFLEAGSRRPALLLDGAHNTAAAETLASSLEKHFPHTPRILIFGALADKDIVGIAQTLAPLAEEIFCVRVKNPRAADPAALVRALHRRVALTRDQNVTDAGDFPTAWELAKTAAAKRADPLVVVTGSLFLCGEALAHLKIPVFGKVATEEFRGTAQ